jgi:basic membrane protein A
MARDTGQLLRGMADGSHHRWRRYEPPAILTSSQRTLRKEVKLMGRLLAGAAIGAILLGIGGCGSTSSSRSNATNVSSAASAQKSVKVNWLYIGPKNDGGYNKSLEPSMYAMAAVDPGRASASGIYGVPVSNQATQITKEAIAGGANVMVDTLGLSSLFTSACGASPHVACFTAVNPGKQLPNVRSYWLDEWNLEYPAGVAAGLMTKTGVLGFITAAKIPLTTSAINEWLLGCQSVRPDCKVRVVYTNNYYDPPAVAQAANTLVSSGADVIRAYTTDSSYCVVAQQRGVYAVADYVTEASVCPKANIVSTVYDFTNYFAQQTKEILAGTWKGGGTDYIGVASSPGAPHIGGWGSFVPSSVRKRVEDVYASILAGKQVIVGPIYDQQGKLRVAAGVHPSPAFMQYSWGWYVKGVRG